MVSGKGLANLFNGRRHGLCPLPLPSGFAEFCNGLGFAGRPGLVNGYLGVDLLDHTAAGEGDKASRRCLGQFCEIVRSGLRTAFVDHGVPEALGLGRWGQCPCSAESHGDQRCMGATADQELQARWRVAGHGFLGRSSGSGWLHGLPGAPRPSQHPKPRILSGDLPASPASDWVPQRGR